MREFHQRLRLEWTHRDGRDVGRRRPLFWRWCARRGQDAVSDVPVVRVKEIARLESVRDNQLTGLGLVVGLSGTGDGRGSQANLQMVANMLAALRPRRERQRSPPAQRRGGDGDRDTSRVFARPGDQLDVTVSSFGDARSLQGGFLLQTPLLAANGEVYAVAQGPVSIGGFNVRSGSSSVQQNHAVVGRVPNGAIVEQAVPVELGDGEHLTWILRNPDFTTASRVADAINERFGAETANAIDQSAVVSSCPRRTPGEPDSFYRPRRGAFRPPGHGRPSRDQ